MANAPKQPKFKQIGKVTCACCSLFIGLIVMGFTQFFATINSGMLLLSNEIAFLEGHEFKKASECPEEVGCTGSGSCLARAFTFTPEVGTCEDYLKDGKYANNLFKAVRPRGKLKKGDTTYIQSNHTCCIKYVKESEHRDNSVVFLLFNMLLAFILFALDAGKALYYECGIKEKLHDRLQNVAADAAKNKIHPIVPSGPSEITDAVNSKVDSLVEEKATQSVNTFLSIGGKALTMIMYFGAVFPLNQIVGNILGVDKSAGGVIFKGDLKGGKPGEHYGVWKPANEKFQTGLFSSIMGAFISAFIATPGFICFAVLFCYIVFRAINLVDKPCGWCGKDDKADKRNSKKLLCFMFCVGTLILIPVIIMYFTMYFSGFPDLPSFFFGFGLNFPPKFPHLGSISIGISLLFATFIRFSVTCFKNCKAWRSCKLPRFGRCGVPECKDFTLPVLGDIWSRQFGTIIITYPKFKFGWNLLCAIPFTFWNMYWLVCCCGMQICQVSCYGTPTFKPKAGKWVINEEDWSEQKETNEYIEELRKKAGQLEAGAVTVSQLRTIRKQFGADSPEYKEALRKAGVNTVKGEIN